MKKLLILISLFASIHCYSQAIAPRSVDEYAQLLREIRDDKVNKDSFTNKLKTFYSKLINKKPKDKPTVEIIYSKGM